MEPDRIIHLNITVSGRVQGVGFRFAAKKMAITFGVRGSIKNLSNGDVFIESEGTQKQLNMFIDWCYRGPAYAHVENVISIEDDTKGYEYFDIVN